LCPSLFVCLFVLCQLTPLSAVLPYKLFFSASQEVSCILWSSKSPLYVPMLIQKYPAQALRPISLRSLYHYLHFSNFFHISFFLGFSTKTAYICGSCHTFFISLTSHLPLFYLFGFKMFLNHFLHSQSAFFREGKTPIFKNV
jgi:hypothetical protein